jgi:DOPA 4,5-dioxygenase
MSEPMTPPMNGYHAHIYYDPATRQAAEELAQAATGNFAVRIGGFFDHPVGPHPLPNLQIIFAAAEVARVVPWLRRNRNGLDILVHALTEDSVRDHSGEAMWLGNPVALRLHVLRSDYRPELLPSA